MDFDFPNLLQSQTESDCTNVWSQKYGFLQAGPRRSMPSYPSARRPRDLQCIVQVREPPESCVFLCGTDQQI